MCCTVSMWPRIPSTTTWIKYKLVPPINHVYMQRCHALVLIVWGGHFELSPWEVWNQDSTKPSWRVPILLLKTPSRKSNWPFHASRKIRKTASRSQKKANNHISRKNTNHIHVAQNIFKQLVHTTQVNSTFRARWLASSEVISQVLFTSTSVNNC